MARFVSLKIRAEAGFAIATALVLCAGELTRGQEAMTMQASATNAASVKPPVKGPATNAATVAAPAPNAPSAKPAPPLPPPVQDTLGRYGKILAPGDEANHPLKLKMPFPGAGEVKVPKQDELHMREKLEQLANLSDDEIRKELLEWPAFSKMSLHDEGVMLQRIQDFRNYRTGFAMQKAHDMGLLTLTQDQKNKFAKEFWDKRLKMDEDLAKQFRPVFDAREQKLEDELFREFSSNAAGPVAQAPKPQTPPAQPPANNKPPQPPAVASASTNKAPANPPAPKPSTPATTTASAPSPATNPSTVGQAVR